MKNTQLLLVLMDRYSRHSISLSKIEVVKMAYLLQCSDVDLGVEFHWGSDWGLQSPDLYEFLEDSEGILYASTYDKYLGRCIDINESVMARCEDRLCLEDTETLVNLDKATKLVNGFECKVGIDALFKVIFITENYPLTNLEDITECIQSYMADGFVGPTEHEIKCAWDRLAELGYINL